MNFGADANVLHCESYKRERVSTEDQSREKMPRGFYVLLSSKNDMTKAKLNIKTCPSCDSKRIKCLRNINPRMRGARGKSGTKGALMFSTSRQGKPNDGKQTFSNKQGPTDPD